MVHSTAQSSGARFGRSAAFKQFQHVINSLYLLDVEVVLPASPLLHDQRPDVPEQLPHLRSHRPTGITTASTPAAPATAGHGFVVDTQLAEELVQHVVPNATAAHEHHGQDAEQQPQVRALLLGPGQVVVAAVL